MKSNYVPYRVISSGKFKGKHVRKQQYKFALYLLTSLEQKAQKMPGFRHAALNWG